MWRHNYKYRDLFAGRWPIEMEIVHIVNNNTICVQIWSLNYFTGLFGYEQQTNRAPIKKRLVACLLKCSYFSVLGSLVSIYAHSINYCKSCERINCTYFIAYLTSIYWLNFHINHPEINSWSNPNPYPKPNQNPTLIEGLNFWIIHMESRPFYN